MEKKPGYKSQQKHIRANYVRFPLDFRPEELEVFRAKCKALGTTPTTEIKKFVRAFCKENEK